MGRDKALVEFEGRPLIAHAVEILRAAGLPVSIAGARSLLESYGPVVPDIDPDLGPLGGICSALESLRYGTETANLAVFLPVDLPLLPPSLIVYLLYHAGVTGAPVTVPSVNGYPQTFPVVLTKETLTVLERELKSGRGGCFAAFETVASHADQKITVLPVELLVQSGQVTHPDVLAPFRWFQNLNSPADLAFVPRGPRVA